MNPTRTHPVPSRKPAELMGDTQTISVHVHERARRIDQLLLNALESLQVQISRSQLKKWFQNQLILYQNHPIAPSFELPLGIHPIQIPRPNTLTPTPQASTQGSFLKILYEDAQLLVLHKTSGVPSAPQTSAQTETAVGSALTYFPPLFGVGDQPLEPGLVHRLDTGTSGALVFAKTQSEFDRLKTLWKKREVVKIYRAISTLEHPLQLPLQVETPLAHHAKSKKRMIALNHSKMIHFRGKPIPALTRVLEGFALPTSPLFDLTVEIETGVMHQIRCHLESIGAPIWGDPIYGRKNFALPAERLWLHAWKLAFPLKSGSPLEIEAPLPPHWPK